jgi:hypothetical protein
MSGLACPHCGKSIELFKTGGGQSTATKEGLRLLGSLPIEPELVKMGDTGDLSMLDADKLHFAGEFGKIVEQIEKLSG